ncbi:hypothetical protein KSP40_PGU020438 [Platanthera guangdongensis]|uniref:Secreted protein n=1 Tax=Platanthera guangdongensis TaxID=2320717 RepID=A0ABR2MW75_9ASPA
MLFILFLFISSSFHIARGCAVCPKPNTPKSPRLHFRRSSESRPLHCRLRSLESLPLPYRRSPESLPLPTAGHRKASRYPTADHRKAARYPTADHWKAARYLASPTSSHRKPPVTLPPITLPPGIGTPKLPAPPVTDLPGGHRKTRACLDILGSVVHIGDPAVNCLPAHRRSREHRGCIMLVHCHKSEASQHQHLLTHCPRTPGHLRQVGAARLHLLLTGVTPCTCCLRRPSIVRTNLDDIWSLCLIPNYLHL